jgi:hypothetical protein
MDGIFLLAEHAVGACKSYGKEVEAIQGVLRTRSLRLASLQVRFPLGVCADFPAMLLQRGGPDIQHSTSTTPTCHVSTNCWTIAVTLMSHDAAMASGTGVAG